MKKPLSGSKWQILYMLITMGFIECEKDPQVEIIHKEIPRIDLNYVNLDQAPGVKQALSVATAGQAKKSTQGKTMNYKKARIDVGNILKVRSPKNSINYTMHVYVDGSPENEFYNLVVHQDASGKPKKPYILRYVVDPEALDLFIASNYNFSYFRGIRYTYKFNHFFSDLDLSKKTTADPCDEATVITNISQAGNGGIRDMPITNNLQTDTSLYDFSQSNSGDSFTLFFNSYDDSSGEDTSYGDAVQTDLIQVTSNDNPNHVIQLPPLESNNSETITLVRTTVSKASATKNSEGTMTGCTITITREYSDGTVVTIDYNCLEAPLKPVYSYKSLGGDCPENEGETGVLTTSAMVAEIVKAYSLSILTKARFVYLNNSPYTPAIYNYLQNNDFSSQAMDFGLAAIDLLSSPSIISTQLIDYENDLKRMIKHLRVWGIRKIKT